LIDRKSLNGFPPLGANAESTHTFAGWKARPDATPKPGREKHSLLSSLAQPISSAGRFLRDTAAGLLAPAMARTEWRRQRLLILGYHGVSLDDEHIWDGGIYMSAELFRRRLTLLGQDQCVVLPLAEALRRLDSGTLPPRAVSIVFDDGFHDFATRAAPILAEFDYRATVFVSSYYAQFNRPVFDIMLSYLLWKGAHKTLLLPAIFDRPLYLSGEGQREARDLVRAAALEQGFTGQAKDELLARIADALEIDYETLCRRRLLHMMNADEVRAVEALGHDVQLHTHRHRVSRNKDLFAREIRDNRRWIRRTLGGAAPVIFSYPGGVFEPVEREWLIDLGIQTAITCRPALAHVRCDKLRLPRVVDNSHTSERVFRAWLAGSMDILPKGAGVETPGQILEETHPCAALGWGRPSAGRGQAFSLPPRPRPRAAADRGARSRI
jgi:peptidoglycan/xylan/chitin deacetylase (PgdA/CDA1 family)